MLYVDLKRLRSDNGGSTQTQLAEIAGCSQSFIAQVESGGRAISDDVLNRLRKYYADLDAYISDVADLSAIRQAPKDEGSDQLETSIVQDKDAEIIRLTTKLDAALNEVAWLRSIVESFAKR